MKFYSNVHVVQDLANKKTFKPVSMSSWHIPIVCWTLYWSLIQKDASGSSHIFPAPVLGLTVSLMGPGFFITGWEITLSLRV